MEIDLKTEIEMLRKRIECLEKFTKINLNPCVAKPVLIKPILQNEKSI